MENYGLFRGMNYTYSKFYTVEISKRDKSKEDLGIFDILDELDFLIERKRAYYQFYLDLFKEDKSIKIYELEDGIPIYQSLPSTNKIEGLVRIFITAFSDKYVLISAQLSIYSETYYEGKIWTDKNITARNDLSKNDVLYISKKQHYDMITDIKFTSLGKINKKGTLNDIINEVKNTLFSFDLELMEEKSKFINVISLWNPIKNYYCKDLSKLIYYNRLFFDSLKQIGYSYLYLNDIQDNKFVINSKKMAYCIANNNIIILRFDDDFPRYTGMRNQLVQMFYLLHMQDYAIKYFNRKSQAIYSELNNNNYVLNKKLIQKMKLLRFNFDKFNYDYFITNRDMRDMSHVAFLEHYKDTLGVNKGISIIEKRISEINDIVQKDENDKLESKINNLSIILAIFAISQILVDLVMWGEEFFFGLNKWHVKGATFILALVLPAAYYFLKKR